MTISKIAVGLAAIALLASCGGSDHKKKPKNNTTPMATADSFKTQADTQYTGTLKGADADGDKLSFATVTAPTNGALTLKSDGSFTYLPNAEFTGTDKFTFNVSDASNTSAYAQVSITVDLLQVSFNDYSRKAFNQAGSDIPLPLNSRSVTQDVTADNAYDDLLAK